MLKNRSNARRLFLTSMAIIGLGGAAASPLSAANVTWTVWSSFSPGNPGTAAGTIALPTSVSVGYSGQVLSSSYTGFGPPPLGIYTTWGGSAYFGGTVNNGPSNEGQIALSGGATTGINTVTFSPAVVDPVMAIWSLGSANTNAAEFDFTAAEPFTIQSGGADFTTGGQSITLGGPNAVTGLEGNGVIQFTGTYSSLTWTNPDFENDYAFTIGADGLVPEPASIGLIAIAALGSLKRRRAS